MGKTDPRQHRLTFDKTWPTGTHDTSSDMEEPANQDHTAASSQDMGPIMVELKAGFHTMEERLNTIAGRIDKLGECLDHQRVRLDVAEERISGLEDGAVTIQKRVEMMEHTLKQAAMTFEDLEARSRRNNIRIAIVPKTINMGRPDTFVEHLHLDLFDCSCFSTIFAVERAYRSLGARPPRSPTLLSHSLPPQLQGQRHRTADGGGAAASEGEPGSPGSCPFWEEDLFGRTQFSHCGILPMHEAVCKRMPEE
ncbi:hypothetical protein NDU88_006139 [Pleurodeles waltl]|uniref:Uncharacterized protein n=1 Tax=Pleurodeles waltl TaxID=8319 RepID=A0AAV7LN74_PLEWA|nr:hypothetical protein NDU88_006139 [Pleurodeles waltl]